jgi:hypothetical protein
LRVTRRSATFLEYFTVEATVIGRTNTVVISNHTLAGPIVFARRIQTLIDDSFAQSTSISRHAEALESGRAIWQENGLARALVLNAPTRLAHVDSTLAEVARVACGTKASKRVAARAQRWVIAVETKIQLPNTLLIILNCVTGIIN